jgi:23S rRNA (pseudouridine1915-N3)-methyltransferase
MRYRPVRVAGASILPCTYDVPMKARLIATGERAPAWVAEGFGEYRKRLSHWLPLELVEVEPGLRGKGRDRQRAIEDEGRRVLAALPKGAHVIALDVPGKPWSSEQLAVRMEHWRQQGRDLAFLIGGPEGHAPGVVAAADESWSLGPLTLPHMLVRLVVAEQLYRAAALLANHPYHRA